MKSDLCLYFSINFKSIFSDLINEYSFKLENESENCFVLFGDNCAVVTGIFDSHKLNIATKLRFGKDQRFLGLGLIALYYDRQIDLGKDYIKTIEDMEIAMKNHAYAISVLCGDLIRGNTETWNSMKSFADKRYTDNQTIKYSDLSPRGGKSQA